MALRVSRGNVKPLRTEIQQQGEWHLRPGLNTRCIASICIAKEDDHVFLADRENESIIELSEHGEILTEFRFDDKNNENYFYFRPVDICLISPDILVVCGWDAGRWWGESKIVFLERGKYDPHLKLKRTVKTKKPVFSLCPKNELVFCCDSIFEVHCFTREGEQLRTIKIPGLITWSVVCSPRIRIDPLSGNFWGSKWFGFSEIVSFNSEGQKLGSVQKGGKEFLDFCLSKFGHFYFTNKEGIFSLFPENKLLYNFPKTSKYFPTISVSENKLVVCTKSEEKDVIKVFHICYK